MVGLSHLHLPHLDALVLNRTMRIAYHHWRMEAAHGSLFSNPQPIGNGLAAFEVTATDVDAAIASYESHRESLVDLGALAHVGASFSALALGETEGHSTEKRQLLTAVILDRLISRNKQRQQPFTANVRVSEDV